MIENKKGMSMIVITMIIILLVIVAVGILWFVVRGALTGGTEQFSLGSKCLSVDIEASASCNNATVAVPQNYFGNCTVRLERKPGGDDIGGVNLIFTNVARDANFIHDVSGNLAEFEIKTEGTDALPINVSFNDAVAYVEDVGKMEVIPYFLDDSGNKQLCSGATATINF